MKTHFLFLIALLGLILFSTPAFSQPPRVKKYLKERDEKYRKKFPETLKDSFPIGSLGEKIQTLYQLQAENSCGIQRADNRLYIPKEIVSGYGEERLRSTMIYDIPIAATNLMFLALTSKDISEIENGTYVENTYINAKRVIGLKDNLVNYGEAILTPIAGFPSLFYQKSCGSYFIGDLRTEIKAPKVELEASLEAETRKTTSITTITGKFFSPLYLIFRQATAQSVYAHLLLWEIYCEQRKENPTELILTEGKYISEFNATLTNRATNSDQSINMNGRLSANISAGIFSAEGIVQGGFDNEVAFSLVDFNTSIHKLSDGNLSYALSDLPRIEQINQKLPNCLHFKPQPSLDGYVTHLLPVKIQRILTGIPSFLCDKKSWVICDDGYERDLWRGKPEVNSIHTVSKEGDYPDCVCTITGYLNETAIEEAIKDKGTLELKLKMENIIAIEGNKLVLEIREPSAKVTDAPKILTINSESINAGRKEIMSSTKTSYIFPVQFVIDDTGVKLTEPYKISNIVIEYLSKNQADQLINSISNIDVKGNTVSVEIETKESPKEYIQEGEFSIPIKIKFSIELEGGSTTQLATNTINLSVPNLVEKVEVETMVLSNSETIYEPE